MLASRHGRGTALQLAVDVPTYNAAAADRCHGSTSPASMMPSRRLTFFAINRHGPETIEVDVLLEGFAAKSVEHTIIAMTISSPQHQGYAGHRGASEGQRCRSREKRVTFTLPPHSYSMIWVSFNSYPILRYIP